MVTNFSFKLNLYRERMVSENLTRSNARISVYRAIASAAYISLNSDDPILEAFELHAELKQQALWEPEFQADYNQLAEQCSV